jgi:hypothetical protein
MPEINLKCTFGKWYKRNKRRFRYLPVFSKKHWNRIEFKFQGLSPRLVCSINRTGATIWVMHDKEVWDILAEFGTYTGRTVWGDYYCDGCPPENRDFFSSKQTLWENHCFEPLLDWINDNLIVSRWVTLFQIEGCTWVELKKKEEIEASRAKEGFVEAFPLVPMRR